jgi:hypothetical protein
MAAKYVYSADKSSGSSGLASWPGGPMDLTMAGRLWEIAPMTTLVKADSRGRVPIRGAKNRRQYLVTAENGGWWVMPAPKFAAPKKIESPAGAWELRAATLESFYDKSKAW